MLAQVNLWRSLQIFVGGFRKKSQGFNELIDEIEGNITIVALWSQESHGGLKSRKVVAWKQKVYIVAKIAVARRSKLCVRRPLLTHPSSDILYCQHPS